MNLLCTAEDRLSARPHVAGKRGDIVEHCFGTEYIEHNMAEFISDLASERGYSLVSRPRVTLKPDAGIPRRGIDIAAQLSDELKQRFAAISREAGPMPESAAANSAPDVTPRGLGLVDVVLGSLFGPAFLLVFVAWLLVVAPLQFVVNLAAGAPARLALASPARAWYRITPHEIHVEEALKSGSVPEGATESGFSAKPVTFTAAIASALLFAVSRLVS